MDEKIDNCRISVADIKALRRNLPDERDVQALAELLRVLGDPTRVRILSTLKAEPMCVKDLSAVLGMQQTAVSHQLKVLRHNRLVRYRREGKMAVYTLDDEHVEDLFRVGMEHIQEYSS